MKIAVISDSHDHITNIHKMLSYLRQQKIKLMIHCGDVCTLNVMRELAEKFNGQIHLVLGNVDGDHYSMEKITKENLKNVIIYDKVGELELAGKKIAFTHFPNVAEELAAIGKYDLVFYGHNHKPWEKVEGRTKLLNPGTLAGLFSRATFAILDTNSNKAELKLLDLI